MQRQWSKLVRGTSRRTLRRSTVEWIVVGVWIAALLAIESAGRGSVSDVTDAAMLLGIGFLTVGTAMVHSQWKLRTVSAVVRKLGQARRYLVQYGIEHGVDLRRSPPIPRSVPARWTRIVTCLAATTIGLAYWYPHFPSGARAALASHLYLAAVMLVGILWLVMALAAIVMGLLFLGTIHDLFVESFRGQGVRPLRPELWTMSAVIAALMACGTWLPGWAPLAIYIALFSVVSVTLMLSSPGLEFAWRLRRGGPIHSLDGRWLVWWHWACLTLLTINLVLLSRGELLAKGGLATSSVTMPLTVLFGNMLAWMAVGGLSVAAFDSVRFASLGVRFNPGRPVRAGLDPGGSDTPPEGHRRAEIENRRQIVRGLEKLFKRAARQSRSRGTGFWIGLQHWFVLGMSRDGEADATNDRETTVLDGIVGPPYHRMFSAESRRHFWQITTALEIDLIFVEDGISFRRLVRVLRVMFETYDVYGGRQRVEERHFVGLPGTRVVIHDYDLCDARSHGRQDYPEPEYQQIGRARILHVFKDRGEQEELQPVPSSWEGVPVFSGV